MSLSDLMILLFIFFVMLFSFSYKKLKQQDVQRMVAALQNKPVPANPIEVMAGKFQAWAVDENLLEQIQISQTDEAVTIAIKDQILFSSGQYSLEAGGTRALSSLARLLEKVPPPYRIAIEGHTDDSPIHTETVEDNWELSWKRALAVFRSLRLSPPTVQRTSIVAHGDTQPLVDNRDGDGVPIPENRSQNRRVSVRIF